MTKYVKSHEAYIKECLKKHKVDAALMQMHSERIEWLQHERLVHLLVMLLAVVVMITFFVLTMFVDVLLIYAIFGITIIVSLFYIVHYYFLENSVQRWYVLSDEMRKRLL